MQRKILTPVTYLLAALADAWLLSSNQLLNEASTFETVLCVIAAILFALGAALVSRRPHVAHMCAAAGVVALPWTYRTTLQGNILVNWWIVFNVPDRELRMYNGLATAKLAILAVALIVFAIATGITRVLPGRLVFRKMPLRERTWPAVAATLCLLAIWFTQSVIPYRIPGALDYSSWPILQILHLKKHGLQFHESCVKVWGHRGVPESVLFSSNDRRLFEYRFQQTFAHAEVPKLLVEHVAALIQVSKSVKSNRNLITPLRRWNDEGWYVVGEEMELQAYTNENRRTPPQEVVDLFEELEKVPRTDNSSEDRKDVCLGFCYDPLSALGALYANHRCRQEETHFVCR